jgi:hypothetical protein
MNCPACGQKFVLLRSVALAFEIALTLYCEGGRGQESDECQEGERPSAPLRASDSTAALGGF